MNDYNCDVCGRSASVHLTNIRDGKKVERHLCSLHADASAIAAMAPAQTVVGGAACPTAEEAALGGIMNNLRGTANYTRRHGRMPASVEELREGMAMTHDSGAAEIADSGVRAQLEYVDGLIDFCQSHGRMPQTPDEMPPAPPRAAG
jgi:hypothetical protein